MIVAGSEGQQPTQWLKGGMLWEPLTLRQAWSPAGPGGPTCLTSGRRETEAGGSYGGLERVSFRPVP